MDRPPGHVFVSYVHEDSERVDKLEEELNAAGIRVWRDTQLWPGDDWEQTIKEAITQDALAFLACFSIASEAREKSYQREELILAAEELRRRRPGRSWLIPVRFDEVDLPYYDLGPGKDLNSLQRIDLVTDPSPNLGRLIAAVTMILARSEVAPAAEDATQRPTVRTSEPPRSQLRAMLRDPTRALDVEDLVLDAASDCLEVITDSDRYPLRLLTSSKIEAVRLVANQALQYFQDMEPFLELLVEGCASGTPEQDPLWTRAIQNVIPTSEHLSGTESLLNLRRLPPVIALYAAAIATTDRSRYGALKAVAIDTRVKLLEGSRVPLVGRAHPALPFESQAAMATAAALLAQDSELSDETIVGLFEGRTGIRHTPVEDMLFAQLRPLFRRSIPNDADYTETWIRAELLLGVLAEDLDLNWDRKNGWVYGPNFGSFTWRNQAGMRDETVEQQFLREIEEAGESWPPLRAGLFGGELERAVASARSFVEHTAQVRPTRWR